MSFKLVIELRWGKLRLTLSLARQRRGREGR
jgi:hypothetical protein